MTINAVIDFLRFKELYFWIYIFLINGYGLILIALDKYKAVKNKWRIRENNFFIVALAGGAAGVLLGMTIFRHKTQHKKFYIGIPVLYLFNKTIILIIKYKFGIFIGL
ncbi:MAG: hypothetical protein PWQ37_1868 [Candidatus Petromonas sp.]|jgi:uncharacterized membrane protein YsdA (DUF1294 family)|nr:hypothetical protein [Candidatus Petromonas sp.]